MREWLLIFIFFGGFALTAQADYFKWEVLVSAEGFGTATQIIPIAAEGVIQKFGNKGECKVEKFWRRIESVLLIEGKTLTCEAGDQKRSTQVICTDNNLNRKYNYSKELYNVSKDGFALDPNLGADSPYLVLRCYF